LEMLLVSIILMVIKLFMMR